MAMFYCRVRTVGYAPARGTTGDHVLLQGTHCRVRTKPWDRCGDHVLLQGTHYRVRTGI